MSVFHFTHFALISKSIQFNCCMDNKKRDEEHFHARLHAKDTSFPDDEMQRPSSQIPFML